MKCKTYQHHRPVCYLAALCAGIVLLISTATVVAKPGDSPLMPPNANYRGLTFEEWNALAVEIDVSNAWGGEELPNTFKRTLFLRNGLWLLEDEFDVQVSPGTALVIPAFFIVGELYDLYIGDIQYEDDPNYPHPYDPEKTIIDFLNESTVVELKFDGEVILGGIAADLVEYQFGVTYFDEPVFYEIPQNRGFADAVASIFTFGVGAVFHPLPPGEYTIESSYVVDAPPFIPLTVANYTFNITVSK